MYGQPRPLIFSDYCLSLTTPKLPQLAYITLLPLTAGSPELNPAEQVWQQLREGSLANLCYDGYEDIVDACCEAWNKFTQIPRRNSLIVHA